VALARRDSKLTQSFAGYSSKEELLLRFVRGRCVLHLGAIGCTSASTAAKIAAAPHSIHSLLSSVSTCVGVDTDAEGVRALTEAGVFDNLITADVQRLSSNEIPLPTIDVIVAGDVIEHLSNPGSMLDSLYAIGGRETRLIVTTPNALGLPNFLRYSVNRWTDGEDHVCSFNRDSLGNLLRRHGWLVEQMQTCYQAGAGQRNMSILFWLGCRVFQWRPRFGGTLFAVARKTDDLRS
jgi:hypothetical protein